METAGTLELAEELIELVDERRKIINPA